MNKMTETNLMEAIDETLDGLSDHYLRGLLEQQSDTIYRLATLKTKCVKTLYL